MPQFGKIIYRIFLVLSQFFHRVFSNQDGPSRFFPALGFRRYVIFQDVPFHTNHFRGCSKIMVPENCLYATFSRTFCAPAESGQGIMIMFSCASMFINSGMQTFREPFARPFAVLRHCSKTHTHPYLQMSLGYSLNGFWNDSHLGAGKWTENGTRRGSRSVSYSPNSVATCGHTVGVLTVSVKGGCSIEVVPVASGILPVNFCPKCLL